MLRRTRVGRSLSVQTWSTNVGPGRWSCDLRTVLHSWSRRGLASAPRISSSRLRVVAVAVAIVVLLREFAHLQCRRQAAGPEFDTLQWSHGEPGRHRRHFHWRLRAG